jgi:hypothetical protein
LDRALQRRTLGRVSTSTTNIPASAGMFFIALPSIRTSIPGNLLTPASGQLAAHVIQLRYQIELILLLCLITCCASFIGTFHGMSFDHTLQIDNPSMTVVLNAGRIALAIFALTLRLKTWTQH